MRLVHPPAGAPGLVDFQPHFTAYAQTAIFEHPATIILKTPLNSATRISYKNRKFRQSESICSRFGRLSLRMSKTPLCLLSDQTPLSSSLLSSTTSISYKSTEILVLSKILGDLWPYFYCACAQTAIFELPAAILRTTLDSASGPDFL